MSTLDHPLVWLDLETTGTDIDTCSVLEVAAIITEPRAPFRRISDGVFTALVAPADGDVAVPYDVVAMHAANGLWLDLAQTAGGTPAGVDNALNAWIGRNVQGSRVTMAGDGVSTFDLQIVRRVFPKTAKRFTYYTLDTSVVRRWMIAAGVPEVHRSTSAHRAEGDVRNAIEWAQRVAAVSEPVPAPVRICADCLEPIADGDDCCHANGRWYHLAHMPWPAWQADQSDEPVTSDTTSSGT